MEFSLRNPCLACCERREPFRRLADRDRTLVNVRLALEAAGVEFIPENGGGAGVRLRKVKDSAAI